MKASLKLREDQKPLVRAKIPLSILGLPFLSGISAGDSKELSLNLATSFDSGPSLRISYRPNDSWNPFSLVVKTGIGSFGSPISAPLAMSAEFSLVGGGNPSFSLQFKPQIGDFSFKKSAGSTIALPPKPQIGDFSFKKSAGSTIAPPPEPGMFGPKIGPIEEDPVADVKGLFDGGETPTSNRGFEPVNGFHNVNGFQPNLRSGGAIDGLLSGLEVSARSVLPLRSSALLKFRWGVRFPERVFSEDGKLQHPSAEISLRKIPLLVMNKISIEHVANDGRATEKSRTAGGDVAEACYSVRRQLETLKTENGLLMKAVEELRSEIGARESVPAAVCQYSGKVLRDVDKSGRNSGPGKKDWPSESNVPAVGGLAGNVTEEGMDVELKKAGI